MKRISTWFSGSDGLIDWCVRYDGADLFEAALPTGELSPGPPKKFRRVRPDGISADWLLAGDPSKRLPFFLQDITPRERRIPLLDSVSHPNGVTQVEALVISGEHEIPVRNTFTDGSPSVAFLDLKAQAAGAVLSLKLACKGSNKGTLPVDKTYGAAIELV